MTNNRSDQRDRKFNVIVFGLPEHPKGTSSDCVERNSLDEEAIARSIQQQVPLFILANIRDSYRLGKYKDSQERPHPILVTLNRASDSSTILSKRSQGDVYFKSDLPPEVRHTQYLLRKERKSLIDKGLAKRGSIRLRRNNLYIGGKLAWKNCQWQFQEV